MFKGLFSALFDAILGMLGLRRASPKIEDIAASNATAQVELVQERAVHAIVTTAAVARADADSRRLHDKQPSDIDNDPAGHWRD